MPRSSGQYPGPPQFFAWLLKRLLPAEERNARQGDFEEIFTDALKREGRKKAALRYRQQVIRSLPSLVRDHLEWGYDMFKNMLKMMYRNFTRHKGYSLINVAGLAVGMESTQRQSVG